MVALLSAKIEEKLFVPDTPEPPMAGLDSFRGEKARQIRGLAQSARGGRTRAQGRMKDKHKWS